MESTSKSSRPAVAAIILVIVAAALAYAFYANSGGSGGTTNSSSTSSTTAPYPLTTLISFSADAYATETTALLQGFSQSTGVPVAPVKSAGSFADANQIAAGAPDDVFVSVALTATSSQYLKNLTANWAVGFASDQMVIAYSNATSAQSVAAEGRAAAASNSTSDWDAFFVSLTSGQAKVGISNPVSDPAGLRGWLVLEAAGFLYSGGNQNAYVSQLLKSGANITGTNAASLVAPLQSGQIQFLFIYKSFAAADHLAYIQLDRHVSLGDPSLGAYYSQFSYKDSAGVTSGAPIILCITVPLSSTNPAEADAFVVYVIKNASTLSSYGLQPFTQAKLYENVSPPTVISELVSQGLLVAAGSLP